LLINEAGCNAVMAMVSAGMVYFFCNRIFKYNDKAAVEFNAMRCF
jgi:hypothetical protein